MNLPPRKQKVVERRYLFVISPVRTGLWSSGKVAFRSSAMPAAAMYYSKVVFEIVVVWHLVLLAALRATAPSPGALLSQNLRLGGKR